MQKSQYYVSPVTSMPNVLLLLDGCIAVLVKAPSIFTALCACCCR